MSPRKPKAATESSAKPTAAEEATPSKPAEEDAKDSTTKRDDGAAKTTNSRAKATARDYEPHYARPGNRRPSDARADSFNKLAWLIEGATGLVEELRHSDLGLSEDFWVHAYAMRREGLLAARAVIDSLLEKSEAMEKAAEEKEERKARRGSVAVDF